MRRPTLQDVARRAGVDRSVASRTLNGKPDARVRSETRQRILDAAQELCYRPNLTARSLRLSRASTLGLLIPDLSNPIYAQIVRGAQVRAAEQGFVVVVGNTGGAPGGEASFLQLAFQGRVDAMLVASATVADRTIREWADSGVPVVTVNRQVKGIPASVILDDTKAGQIATRHLKDLGHERLGMIAGMRNIDTSRRRKAGFLAEAVGMDVAFSPPAGSDPKSGARAVIQMLSESPRVTGVVAFSLRAAIGAHFALLNHGYQIPGDISLVAIHDDSVAAYMTPPITAVRMPMEELGAASVDMALQQLAGDKPHALTLSDAPRLIVRGSTGRYTPRM